MGRLWSKHIARNIECLNSYVNCCKSVTSILQRHKAIDSAAIATVKMAHPTQSVPVPDRLIPYGADKNPVFCCLLSAQIGRDLPPNDPP